MGKYINILEHNESPESKPLLASEADRTSELKPKDYRVAGSIEIPVESFRFPEHSSYILSGMPYIEVYTIGDLARRPEKGIKGLEDMAAAAAREKGITSRLMPELLEYFAEASFNFELAKTDVFHTKLLSRQDDNRLRSTLIFSYKGEFNESSVIDEAERIGKFGSDEFYTQYIAFIGNDLTEVRKVGEASLHRVSFKTRNDDSKPMIEWRIDPFLYLEGHHKTKVPSAEEIRRKRLEDSANKWWHNRIPRDSHR